MEIALGYKYPDIFHRNGSKGPQAGTSETPGHQVI